MRLGIACLVASVSLATQIERVKRYICVLPCLILYSPLFVRFRVLARKYPSFWGHCSEHSRREPSRVSAILCTCRHTVIDRRNRPGIAYAPEGAIVTLEVRIDRHQPAPSGRSNVPHRVYAHDDTGEISLTFFHAKQAWLEKVMPVGETIIVSGTMEWFNGRPTMVHPDHIASLEDAASLPLVEPIYPLTAGLSPKVLARSVQEALGKTPDMPEWIDPPVLEKYNLPSHRQALQILHNPQDPSDIALDHPARQRLAYDEFLAGQLALALVRMKTQPAFRSQA